MAENEKEIVREIPVADADFDSPFYGPVKDLLDRYTHCPMCGSLLHFTHLTDFSRNITKETASCPECGSRPRKSTHRLQ